MIIALHGTAADQGDVMSYTDDQKLIETKVFEALDALTRNDTAKWSELFADDGVQEFPYAPDGLPKRIESKAGIAEYLKEYPKTFVLHRISAPVWHHDGDTAIAEFAVEGTAVSTGKPYNQRYISVIEQRGGKITRYVDYWNPQIVAEALT
jgi:uncharacterized protein